MIDFQLSEKERRVFECLEKQSKSQRSDKTGKIFRRVKKCVFLYVIVYNSLNFAEFDGNTL